MTLVLLVAASAGCSTGRTAAAPTLAPTPVTTATVQTVLQPGSAPTRSTTAPIPSGSGRGGPAPVTPRAGTLHYITNVGDDMSLVARLGYDLLDTGPDPANIGALPAGTRALVWLGSLDNADCGSPSYSYAHFTARVDRLTGNPRVYGYFLADEPHPRICPTAVADIRQRADYIRAHDPTHRSFIVVLDGTNQCGGTYGCEFAALQPAASHVDLIGLDPYPCNVEASGCVYSKIDDTARRARAHGIGASQIVPVFQAFGQSCAASDYYRQPTAAELGTILAHWAAVVPHPAFDYTYTWGHQGSSCPTLVDSTALQSVMRTHNST